MTEASAQALQGLRDLTTMQWYAIPLLAIVIYIYAVEAKQARRSGDWNALYAGLTLFGMDFVNETWNGWVFALTGHAACWTVPGDSALRTMVGWNLEIMFMFAIAGIGYYHTLSDDPRATILGLPNRWFWAIGFAAFCVFVEVGLNIGGHLVWEWPLWNRSWQGIWLIFLFGYLHFYVAVNLVTGLRTDRRKIIAIASIWSVAIAMNVLGLGVFGWVY